MSIDDLAPNVKATEQGILCGCFDLISGTYDNECTRCEGRPHEGHWEDCSPALLQSGVDCATTLRRPGNWYSHYHWVAAHSQPQSKDA